MGQSNDSDYQDETGAVYRWDFDGSNGIRIDPPQDYNQEPNVVK